VQRVADAFREGEIGEHLAIVLPADVARACEYVVARKADENGEEDWSADKYDESDNPRGNEEQPRADFASAIIMRTASATIRDVQRDERQDDPEYIKREVWRPPDHIRWRRAQHLIKLLLHGPLDCLQRQLNFI